MTTGAGACAAWFIVHDVCPAMRAEGAGALQVHMSEKQQREFVTQLVEQFDEVSGGPGCCSPVVMYAVLAVVAVHVHVHDCPGRRIS